MSLGFAPLLPPWLLAGLTIAAFALTWWRYRRFSAPAILRYVALGIVVVLAANPVRHGAQERREPPVILAVADASQSMARLDGDEQAHSRLVAAQAALTAVAKGAGAEVRIEAQGLREVLSAGAPSQTSGNTAYIALATLTELPRPPLAVVLASDGADFGGEEPGQALAAAGIPVFALPIGTPTAPDNAWVRLETSSPTTFPGQTLALQVQVGATGGALNRQSELVISNGSGEEIHRSTLSLTAQQRIPLTVTIGATTGPQRWHAVLKTVGEEATPDDNESWAVTQVVDRPITVAVLEGKPFWDTTYAVRAWRRDQQIQLGAMYRLGERAFRSGEQVRVDDDDFFTKHDVIVVGVDVETLLDDATQERLLAAVRAGTGLLLIGVHEGFTGPLSAADPLLRTQGVHRDAEVSATAAGRRLSLAADESLHGVTVGRTSGIRALGEILVGDDQHPAVVMRRHGAGRVACVNAEGLWRLSLSGADPTAPARFWRALLKALVADADAAITADRNRYRVGQTARLAVRDGESVAVLRPGADTAVVTPVSAGLALVSLSHAGLWRIGTAPAAIDLVVDPNVAEVVDSARRDDALQRLADATGGEVVAPSAAEELGQRLRRRADLLVPTPTMTPLVPGSPLIVLLILVLGAEWFLRRRLYGKV